MFPKPSNESGSMTSKGEAYGSLDDLAAPALVKNSRDEEGTLYQPQFLEEARGRDPDHHELEHGSSRNLDHEEDNNGNGEYEVIDNYPGLNELTAPSPVDNLREEQKCQPEFLERTHSREQTYEREVEGRAEHLVNPNVNTSSETITTLRRRGRASKFVTQLYVVSYLILFSILGTLARLGLEALTTYPGSPLTISVLWANFGGSFIMGFFSEDRKLFTQGYGSKEHEMDSEKRDDDGETGVADGGSSQSETQDPIDGEAERAEAKKAHTALKKTIPLYIGLTTGFCGSFTSFSSFMRDCFLALSNEPLIVQPGNTLPTSAASRNGGYSFMALIAVILLTISLCLSALQAGAHVAIMLDSVTPTIPVSLTRKILDRSVVIMASGVWIGSIFMALWPPDRPSGPAGQGNTSWKQDTWRGQVVFALIFAPVGSLLRFYASMHMNSIFTTFPLGTFVVNISGTAVLGICWDLQHAPLGSTGASIGGGIVGCQVLQGIQDGFCGCLTTVSTWVLELLGLRRKHSCFYGIISIGVGLVVLVIIMGSLAWSRGFSETACLT
jgi:fluoride exporter